MKDKRNAENISNLLDIHQRKRSVEPLHQQAIGPTPSSKRKLQSKVIL